MRKLSFQTDAFPTTPEGALDYCTGMPGSAAARWLRDVVEAAGFPCKEPFQEEYGWGFWLRSPCMIWVAVSHTGGDSGSTEHPPEWVVSVAHEHPFFAPFQWFKGAQCRPLVEEVFAAIESAASIGSDISLHN
jgi:hypothetical protein